MEDVEVFSIVSSDSNSTIIDESLSTQFYSSTSENSVNTKTCNKNMYDLSEFESENACEALYENTKQSFERIKSEDILQELSKKYLPKKSQSNDEIVLLSDSSSASESEYNVNYSNKDNALMELDENNTIFENISSPYSLPRNQIDYNKVILSPVASENILVKNNFPLKRTLESCSDEDIDCEKKIENKGRQKRIANNEKKLATAEKKAMKEKERMKKKEQLEKEKALKQAQRTVEKSLKPEDCLKFIVLNMDDSVFNSKEYGDYLKEHFASKDISCLMKTSLPGMISFTRKVIAIENMEVKKSEYLEKHYAVIIKPAAFGNLTSCIQSIKVQTDFQHLSIFVFGQSKPTSSQEDEIIDIEICFPTYWQFVKNKEDLGSSVFMLTKSIAQIPYKLEQEAKYSHQSEYLECYNKKLVKVDKDGNGLGQLWRQMLTMFPLVRLETAEAITAVYPTPKSIFEAYENCSEPEQLIQNLQIRRTQGPLAANRRIGPELSKKCYRFFTSKENTLL